MHMTNKASETLIGKSTGFSAVIKDLVGDETIIARLRELGFVRGESVKLQGRSPFGDPLLVQVKDTVVALRKEEVLCILL